MERRIEVALLRFRHDAVNDSIAEMRQRCQSRGDFLQERVAS
jgi:hypothetical protein